jgi:hypothetical protein
MIEKRVINHRIIIALAFSMLLASLEGCLFVREKQDLPPPVILSPQPEIAMSDEIVRSRPGDMIAQLPQGWALIDIEGKAPSDVIAIAVNPDYTLSAVFSTVRKTESADSVVQQEGVYALIRMAMAKHERKTAGAIRQVSKPSEIKIGARTFGYIEFTGSNPVLRTKVAVFSSSLGNFYEFALVPLSVSGKPLPSDEEIKRTFRSITTTIQF